MLRAATIALGLMLVTVPVVGASQAATGPLPAGWAPGGSSADPSSQVREDTLCGPNSVLLFSARGSGDLYGGDFAHNRVGSWTQAAGNALGNAGWQVRDLQAIYSAPPVPSFGTIVKAALLGGNGRVVLIGKSYRDAVSVSWQSVRSELNAAYLRCPSRPILLAGYSQGGILLRYIVPHLPAGIVKRIVSVDLIADPTEQAAVDSGLQHPAGLDGRLTTDGIDTWAGAAIHAGVGFRQAAYPTALQDRVYQYCKPTDLVCDFSAGNLNPLRVLHEGTVHASYAFAAIGQAAAARLGHFSPQSPSGGPHGQPASGSVSDLAVCPFSDSTSVGADPASGFDVRACNRDYGGSLDPTAAVGCSAKVVNGGDQSFYLTLTSPDGSQLSSPPETIGGPTWYVFIYRSWDASAPSGVYRCDVHLGSAIAASRLFRIG